MDIRQRPFSRFTQFLIFRQNRLIRRRFRPVD
jgi:hypothetical protein